MEETIEEQIMAAEAAPESEVKLDETEPLTAMSPVKMQSAGYVYIYNTKTGERSICNRNMLAAHLKKKRPDGSLIFTTRKPRVAPKRGTLKCMLHPDERKPIYDEWKLPICMKSNLTSPFQVRRHMQKRHKDEWNSINEEITRREKEQERADKAKDRKLQEALIKSVSKKK